MSVTETSNWLPDPAALASLDHKTQVARDWVTAVATGHQTGLYLYGPGGVGKSHTVLDQLGRLGADPNQAGPPSPSSGGSMSTPVVAPAPGEDRPKVLADTLGTLRERPGNLLHIAPTLVHRSPFNRETPLAKLQSLIDSVRAQGQLVPGLVRPHPALPGHYECIYGHRRLTVQQFLNGEFVAILHEGPLSDADIIGMQLTENIQQQAMLPWEVADAVQQFTLKKGCTQGEAAGLLAIDESVVSKAVTIANKLIAEYRPLLESGEVRWSSAYLVATLPPDLQRQVNPRKKRALLETDIKILKGKPERKAKTVKHKDEFGLIEFRANTPREQIIDWLTKKIGELKKGAL